MVKNRHPANLATTEENPADGVDKKPMAVFGTSLRIKGEFSGSDDLLIDGQVQGKINFSGQKVIIGKSGRVDADLLGRIVIIEGQLKGDVVAEEKIVVRKSAVVWGNLTAPRVVVEDGASFHGNIDTDLGDQPHEAKPQIAKTISVGIV